MKKILLLACIIFPMLFLSCEDNDDETNLYGIWVSQEDGQKGNIWVFNEDNTGTLLYVVEISEDGTYICDECLSEKITHFSLKDKTIELDFETYSVPYRYDYINENEFKLWNKPLLKKNISAKIKEEKISCE